MSEHIAIIEDQGVMEIQIDRPDKKNALTAAMYRAMIAALADASARPEIGVVLIAGRGDAFCAGNDIADFMAGPEGGAAAFDFIQAIAAFDKPLVAAVQGLAVGVGTTMLFHCDLVYAAPDARFVMPFVNLGLVPEAGSSLLAPAILGHARAAAMLMLGEPMDAEGADRAGFVTAIVTGRTARCAGRGQRRPGDRRGRRRPAARPCPRAGGRPHGETTPGARCDAPADEGRSRAARAPDGGGSTAVPPGHGLARSARSLHRLLRKARAGLSARLSDQPAGGGVLRRRPKSSSLTITAATTSSPPSKAAGGSLSPAMRPKTPAHTGSPA